MGSRSEFSFYICRCYKYLKWREMYFYKRNSVPTCGGVNVGILPCILINMNIQSYADQQGCSKVCQQHRQYALTQLSQCFLCACAPPSGMWQECDLQPDKFMVLCLNWKRNSLEFTASTAFPIGQKWHGLSKLRIAHVVNNLKERRASNCL